jgi:ferrochelatase
MDGFVLDMPAALRWPLVNIAIVPRRRKQSAELYQKIHSEQGPPLLVNTRQLAEKVSGQLAASNGREYVVKFGMRYGNPSISAALAELKSAGVDRVLALPLYPQYAESSFETAVVETKKRARELDSSKVTFLPPFYAEPAFINACVQRVNDHLQEFSLDHLVFSFHGVPVRHLKRLDKSKQHCTVAPNCCEEVSSLNQNCYRAQCMATARAIMQQAGLNEGFCSTTFQSRFGRTEWVGPATDEVLRQLAGKGVKKVAVFCPSFVADCLETLEEIAIRGKETFVAAGGEELRLVPSLNTHPLWVAAISNWIVKEASRR